VIVLNVLSVAEKACPQLKQVLYVSTADQLLPSPFNCLLDQKYWQTKRQAETFLSQWEHPSATRSIFRPGNI
jgi:hypothetical protein